MAEVRLWLPAGLDLATRMAAAGLGHQTIYAEWWAPEVLRWGTLYQVPPGQFVPLAFTHLESGIPRNLIGRIKQALIPDVLETDSRYWFGPGECAGTGWPRRRGQAGAGDPVLHLAPLRVAAMHFGLPPPAPPVIPPRRQTHRGPGGPP